MNFNEIEQKMKEEKLLDNSPCDIKTLMMRIRTKMRSLLSEDINSKISISLSEDCLFLSPSSKDNSKKPDLMIKVIKYPAGPGKFQFEYLRFIKMDKNGLMENIKSINHYVAYYNKIESSNSQENNRIVGMFDRQLQDVGLSYEDFKKIESKYKKINKTNKKIIHQYLG